MEERSDLRRRLAGGLVVNLCKLTWVDIWVQNGYPTICPISSGKKCDLELAEQTYTIL